MGEPLLVFTGLWFGIYLGLPSEKYKIVSWKKKEFEDLEDLLVSFRLYFARVTLPCIIYCYKYMVLIFKKR
jgi:hypothetical protein